MVILKEVGEERMDQEGAREEMDRRRKLQE